VAAASNAARPAAAEATRLSPEEYDARIAAGDTEGELSRMGIYRAREGGSTSGIDFDAVHARILAEQEAEKQASKTPSTSRAGATDNRTAFEKGMDRVVDSFATRRGRIESEIALEAARGNTQAQRTAQQAFIDMLQEKILAVTGLDRFVRSADERNLLEAAKNKLLTEIARIGNDIRGNTEKLVGEFNKPSEIAAMTEYAYNVSQGDSFMTRIVSSPTQNIYLTVKDLGANSVAETRNRLMNLGNALARKDDIVAAGLRDIARN
jgi:hypothetical protein